VAPRSGGFDGSIDPMPQLDDPEFPPARHLLLVHGPARIVEWTDPLTDAREATDVVGACFEHDTDRVLLDEAVLPPAFFALRTRFAGEFLEKLQTYRLRAAVVVSPAADHGERFAEYLREARQGRYCRFLDSREEALAWLARE